MPQVTWCDNGCSKPSCGKLITVSDMGVTVHHLCKDCRKARLRPKRESGEYRAVEKKTG